MDILYLLIPLSILVVFGVIALFWWALQGGQFDNIEREGERILRADRDELDADQSSAIPAAKESTPRIERVS